MRETRCGTTKDSCRLTMRENRCCIRIQSNKKQSTETHHREYKLLLINKSINDANYTSPSEGMSTDDNTGIQTRAMAKVQCVEGEANWELINNPEQAQHTKSNHESHSGSAQNQGGSHQGVCLTTRHNHPRLVCTKLLQHSSRRFNHRKTPHRNHTRQNTIQLPSTQ